MGIRQSMLPQSWVYRSRWCTACVPGGDMLSGELEPWRLDLPSEWREQARRAAESDARVHGFGLALHRRIRELDTDCGACFASVGTLAKSLGCVGRTVQRWLRKLEAWGYVLRLDREWKSGMRRSHVLVPVAPVGNPKHVPISDLIARTGLARRAWDHAARCARAWLPSWGIRSVSPIGSCPKQGVSSHDTVETVTARSWFEADEEGDAARIFAGWGSATGPGPGDPGWPELTKGAIPEVAT